MLASRFLWKLFLSFAVVILLTTSVVGYLVSRQMQQDTLTEVDRRLQHSALLLRDLVLQDLALQDLVLQDLADDEGLKEASPELQSIINRIGRETGTRLTLIRSDGVVVADSAERPELMSNHGDRPEVQQAAREGLGTATRSSATIRQGMRYLALPLRPGEGANDEASGFVRTSIPLTIVEGRTAALGNAVLFAAAVAALFGLALSFLLARRVTLPILAVTSVAESLAKGEYDRRVPVDSEDEIGALARAFNRMAGELEDRLQTIDRDRNQLLAILGGMMEGVVALDAQEQVVHVNSAAAQMLEIDPAESLGKKIWEVIRVPAIGEALSQALEGGASSVEAKIVHENRITASTTDRTIELHAAPLHQGGAVLVLSDVTHLRHLEAVRQDFVANVSHELKTPITAIVGLVDTILDDPAMPADTAEKFLEKIRLNSQRLSTQISDLLALSRLESGDRTLETSLLDLRQPLLDALRGQSAQAEAKNLKMETVLPEVQVPVKGDAEALREAVENLLSNAVRYTPEGGEVFVRLTTRGTTASIEVKDTGPGIEPRHQERIFERFYRIDRARSRELGGTGLGLSIVKHTTLAHEGRVSVESQPGKGSTFRITLPLSG